MDSRDDMDASDAGNDEPMLLELPPEQEHDTEEDVDPSYDPSAFLYGLSSARQTSRPPAPTDGAASSRIHSDLQVSDSDGEEDEGRGGAGPSEPADPDDDGALYF
ncbi:hypothetical protein FJT64_019121 [Amphibalanus amphitrite]|uniref:Uncharacterized protein n=1 Tax=Amphibalanus amphitrite TaxID=1232801 RepID=A0A6A4X4G5_AMPAM|nr:hypothetical protein FJT64_019121 [Amphibalanus amphitrite]